MSENKTASGSKRVWIDGAPMSELAELAKSYSRVALKIHRYDQRGGLAVLYARALFTPAEIATIESWLQMQAGGGAYPIIVTDPADPLREICSSFVVKAEGPSRAPSPIDEQHADPEQPQNPPEWDRERDRAVQQPWQPQQAWGRAASPTPYAGSYPGRASQHQQAQQQQTQLPPGATMASDQLLRQELDENKRKLERLEAENKQLLRASEDRLRQAELALAAERERAREERHRLELQAMRDQIAALANAPRKDDGGGSFKALEILAPLLLPVFTAWVQQSGSSQARLMEALILKGQGSDPFADLARIEPLITKLAGGRGTKDESALLAKMNEGQMQNVLLMAELVKSFAEEKLPEDSPGMKILQQVVGSVGSMGEAYFKQKAEEAEREAQEKLRLAQAERNKALAAEAASRRVQEVVSSPPPQPSQQAPVQRSSGAPTNAGGPPQPTLPPELVAQMAMLPPSFQTPEWKKLLTELHLETNGKPIHEAEEMGNYIAHYLEHLVMFGALPAELGGMLTNPQGTIDTVLTLLPVARKHPEYAKAVGAVVAKVFSRHAQPEASAPAPAPAATNGSGEEPAEEEEDDDEVVTYPQ